MSMVTEIFTTIYSSFPSEAANSSRPIAQYNNIRLVVVIRHKEADEPRWTFKSNVRSEG